MDRTVQCTYLTVVRCKYTWCNASQVPVEVMEAGVKAWKTPVDFQKRSVRCKIRAEMQIEQSESTELQTSVSCKPMWCIVPVEILKKMWTSQKQ